MKKAWVLVMSHVINYETLNQLLDLSDLLIYNM